MADTALLDDLDPSTPIGSCLTAWHRLFARDAVLEFETEMAGKYVNGVDLITCDDDGLIVDFKVMVRPQRALEAVRETMFAALEQLQS